MKKYMLLAIIYLALSAYCMEEKILENRPQSLLAITTATIGDRLICDLITKKSMTWLTEKDLPEELREFLSIYLFSHHGNELFLHFSGLTEIAY